jgi:hypothetical protein
MSVSEVEHSNPSRNIGPLPSEVVVICTAPASSFNLKLIEFNTKISLTSAVKASNTSTYSFSILLAKEIITYRTPSIIDTNFNSAS